jgi:hypothetical protein
LPHLFAQLEFNNFVVTQFLDFLNILHPKEKN